jgi:serine/threonine protein kinase
MPAPATVPEFLELVRKSGLAPENKLNELLGRHRATGSPQTVDQAAALLVRDAQLTFFQSKQLKLGRYKRFTIGAKYRLLELIGAGGMGAVYLCEHTLMKRLVALKVLPVEKLDEQSNLERFYREARAVAALDHPNIVRAYDIDQYEKLHFLVMEYVDGHSLQEIVARYALEKKQFDPVRAAHYIAQAAVGMQHAHELGMVHRDIKPGNLLLDRTGVIKVLDMGLARFFNKQQDSVTEKYDEKCVLGTADYLAPEQAVSNVVDVRADIYSLGGTLYFMLTGQTPFPEGTIAAKLVAHQTREPRTVESFRSDVPPGILAVLQKMMAKSMTERYQQPIEVAEALAEWADHPIAPPPEREMPALCPLVQSLMGPSSERSGAHTPLARALFGPGRGVFSRSGGGSSANMKDRSASSSSDSTTGSNIAFPVQVPSGPRYTAGPNAPAVGPVSTGRNSTAPTAPELPGVAPSPNGPEAILGKGAARPKPRPRPLESMKAPPAQVLPAQPRRVWLFVGIGFGVVVLLAITALVAYQLGKGNTGRGEAPPTTADSAKSLAGVPGSAPVGGAPAKVLTPAQAVRQVGEEQTVEFRVRSVEDTPTHLSLVAETSPGEEFAVHIGPDDHPERPKSFLQDVKHDYEGKRIQARGTIQRDPDTKGYMIVVNARTEIRVVR